MVISGIGYCDIHGTFQFHKNVAEGLQIYNGSIWYCVYHPRPKNEQHFDRIKYHFMLTPIPYKIWPRTARFVIRLKHKRHSLDNILDGHTRGIQEISDFLSQLGVAIVYSFSNRSAHRYSTWDMHVCFDKIFSEQLNYLELINLYEKDKMAFYAFLRNKEKNLKSLTNDDLKNSYDNKKSYYREVFVFSKYVQHLIREKFKSILFEDPEDVDLIDSVIARINTSCHYFYFDSKRLPKRYPSEASAYGVLTFRYSNGYFYPDERGKINEVIKIIEPSVTEFQLPSICFSEADSHYLNLRIIIIPNYLKHRFFKLSIFHERISNETNGIIGNDTSRGLLSYVSSKLDKKDYQIWKSSTLIFEDREKGKESYCNGKLSLFVEAHSKGDFSEQDANEKKNNLQKFLNTLIPGERFPDLSHIRIKGKCERVFPELLKRYFKISERDLDVQKTDFEIRRKLKYDVFLSYSSADQDLADTVITALENERCKVFASSTKIGRGDPIAPKILQGLYESREFCVLLTENSMSSQWVTSEWGAAWALKLRPYTAILGGLTVEKLKSKLDIRIAEKYCLEWPVGSNKIINDYAVNVYRGRFETMLNYDDYEYHS